MRDPYTCLSISLFCERDRWHDILRNGVKTFLKYETSAAIVAFEIALSYERGENIRFSILTRRSNADYILLKADDYFKSFFARTPDCAVSVKDKIPSNAFFKPFPPNTILYGVYETDWVTSENSIRHYKFTSWLSIHLIEALNEPIDFSSLLTVSFSLHICILAALRRNFDLPVEIYLVAYLKLKNRKYYNDDLIRTTKEDLELFETQYDENSIFLHEIKEQIYNPVSWERQLLWLKKCHRLLSKEVDRRIGETSTPQIIYFQLSNSIQGQLGYNNEMQSLLNFFIARMHSGQVPENV